MLLGEQVLQAQRVSQLAKRKTVILAPQIRLVRVEYVISIVAKVMPPTVRTKRMSRIIIIAIAVLVASLRHDGKQVCPNGDVKNVGNEISAYKKM